MYLWLRMSLLDPSQISYSVVKTVPLLQSTSFSTRLLVVVPYSLLFFEYPPQSFEVVKNTKCAFQFYSL